MLLVGMFAVVFSLAELAPFSLLLNLLVFAIFIFIFDRESFSLLHSQTLSDFRRLHDLLVKQKASSFLLSFQLRSVILVGGTLSSSFTKAPL